jgi:ribonuclease J
MILDIANKCGRKVGVIGRSMLNTIAQARLLGYIKCPDDVFVPLQVINQLPDDKILILSTGSQGEPLAAMTRIANDAYRQVQVKKGDTIIFSANPIPGNTLSVTATIDKLMIKGANVVYGRDKGIHVSGHGCQEDQKLMLSLTRPKYFIPVHGEHRMLVKHSQTAQSMGIPAENMVIIDNGDIVELTPNSLQKAGKVPSGIQLVDRAGIVHDTVMKERQQIAEDGVITAAVAINTSGKLLARPQLNFSGVVMSVEPNLVNNLAVKRIESTIADRWGNFARNLEPGKLDIDWAGLRIELEMTLKRLLHQELKTEPLVMVLLQTPPGVAPLPVSAINTTPTKVIPTPKSLDNPGDRAGNNNASNNVVIKRTPVPVKEKEATATTNTTPTTGRRRTRSTAQS